MKSHNKKKIRALIICNSYPTNINPYHQIFIKNLNKELKKLNVVSDVFYNKIFLFWKDASQHKNLISFLIKYSFFFIGVVPLFLGSTKKYDVITPHSIIFSGFIGVLLKKIYKKNVVTYIHGGDLNKYPQSSIFYKKLFVYTVKHTDHFIANSVDIKNKLSKYFDLDLNKTTTISPGINLDNFFPFKNNILINQKEKLCIEKNKFIILFVGNAIKRKGADILIKALNILPKSILEQTLTIMITEGPEKNEYINLLYKFILARYVKFYNKMEQHNLNKFYNVSNLVVIPSREEPLGLVGLEALATKTPVIASNVGGLSEYIKHGYNGLLFEKEDYKMLARSIINLITNTSIYSKLKSKTHIYPNQNSIQSSAQRIKKIYKKYMDSV